MALTSNQLIQINATVIAGLLVLLGIMTQQSQAIFGMKDVDSTILEFSLLIQIIIQTLIIPFALSATIEVVHSIKNKEREMRAAAVRLDFELAAILRDELRTLKNPKEQEKILKTN